MVLLLLLLKGTHELLNVVACENQFFQIGQGMLQILSNATRERFRTVQRKHTMLANKDRSSDIQQSPFF